MIEALKLGFPNVLDRPAAEGSNAWGKVFGRFGIEAVPYAAIADGKGKIVAVGSVEHILDKVRELTREGR